MLTPKQKRFVDLYIGECVYNATSAARKAGYTSVSSGGMRNKANYLLKKPDVKEYLAKRQKEIDEGNVCNAKELKEFLSRCIRGEETESHYIVVRHGNKGEFTDEIVEKDVPYKARDRIKAAEIMTKVLGLNDVDNNKVPQITINNSIPKDE